VSRRPVAKPKTPKATTPLPRTAKPKGKAGKAVSPPQVMKLLAIPPKRKTQSEPKLPPPPPVPTSGMALHTADGARKYLTVGEREAFLREAERAERKIRTLCMTLAYAGCRLSKTLALTVDRADRRQGTGV